MEIRNIDEVGCKPFKFIQNGQCWCFCIETLHKWVTTEARTNPMTRAVLSNDIINRIKKEYVNPVDEDADAKPVEEFMNLVVESQTSIALKYGKKPTIEQTIDDTYEMLKELYELEGGDEAELKLIDLPRIKMVALRKLKAEGRR